MAQIKFVMLCFNIFLLFKNHNGYELQMVTDVIKSYKTPTFVIAKVCWKLPEKAKFVSQLRNVTNAISFIDEITSDFTIETNAIFVVFASCPSLTQFYLQANEKQKFSVPYRWFIIGKQLNETNVIPNHLNKLNILIDSEVIIAQKISDNEYNLYMVYKIKPGSDWKREYFGRWTSMKGLIKSKSMELSAAVRRKNFSKEHIVTCTVMSDNTTDFNDLRHFQVDTMSKIGFRQISPLYDYINATQVLLTVDTWGYLINGTWNGMIRKLIDGQAELAGSVTLMTKERIEILDYLSYPTPVDVKFVFREPSLSYTNNLFLLPFKTIVWYCIAAYVLILVVILYSNASWESQTSRNQCADGVSPAPDPNWSDVAILIVSAIAQQGSSMEFKGTVGRVVVFILFLTFLFLYTSYSASIVVLLQSSSNQIRTLSDLLNSRLELGVEDTPYNRYFFAHTTEPIRKAIYETKIVPSESKPKFLSLEDGVKNLQKKPFAFNMNLGTGYRYVEKYFHEHEKCGLQEIDFLRFKPWFSCRKHSPFKEIFKIGLFRIQEHGLNDRANRLLLSKKPACTVRGGSFASVNLIDIYPVIMMLIFGMIIAFITLFTEILLHRLGNFQRNSNIVFQR